ncbi:hypothetical protein HBO10_29580 [Pseudomonas sp. WS 5503]|uniref:hypothetical protein n=1 Tax=Pseudomonas TaxID=286 RepID=UPI0014758105|nr:MULTISPECIES: hypothetical protein [Pseudomonas]MBF6043415.1 hypothetical protein [Pseudomonas mucoides]NMX83659.1 hypothetical protein [Pseudomonas sp. WS 5503]NNB23633.1 hypothetical protein [Pseudomonas fragi]
MSLKRISNELEQLCTVKDLFVYEVPAGDRREVYPVITEYTRTSPESRHMGHYEFYRARAVHPAASGSSFHTWNNQVSVVICHQTQCVKFGPTGQLIMHKKGVGLGPALMSNVIEWLTKQDVAGYTIEPGSLADIDASTEKAREQRNRFYMAFGFVLSNHDQSKTGIEVIGGSFTAECVGDLLVPDRYQSRLKPWFGFESDLRDERECGVKSLAELKLIDRWTYSASSLCRWILKQLGWPAHFTTRHMHKRKSWEPHPIKTSAQTPD